MLGKLPVQISILIIAGLLLGIINNSLSPRGIPWIQKYMDLSKITDADSIWLPYSWDPKNDTVFDI